MKRLHVHVSVDNLVDSIKFYSGMFASEPTVVKPDYAKWMLEDPRMNFAISQRGAKAGLDHFGIQVESDAELSEMQVRLDSLRPGIEKEEGVACCYARSDKYWVTDPAGIGWETFHTLDAIPTFNELRAEPMKQVRGIALTAISAADDTACCASSASARPGSSCC